ncbi:vesicle transport v-snare protein vti1 [Lyophyllum atratum]|nr:vesicle transport v-snare protein vti1 [Lyophyllum atratum]
MDQTPTALFDSYELDFRHIVEGIKDKLESSGTGEQRKAALRKVEIELDEADDIVSALEVEIQGIPQSIKSQYLSRLKQAKADLTRFKKLAKDVHAQQSRTELLARSGGGGGGGGGFSDDPYGEQSDRARLLAGTQTLDSGNRRLRDTQRVALETEDVGADILRNLVGQRETIENARTTLHTADTNIDRAGGTVKKMIRQMYKQRVILIGMTVGIILLIIIILYFKIVR